jgi:Gas vesicle protein G
VGLISTLLLLPLAPVQGVLWLAQTLQDVAERELDDPDRLRQVLRDAEEAHAHGELSDEDFAVVEQHVLDRLLPIATHGGQVG